MSGVHRFCVSTDEGPQARRVDTSASWAWFTYLQAAENGDDVAEGRFGRHDGSKRMAREVVTLENESRSTTVDHKSQPCEGPNRWGGMPIAIAAKETDGAKRDPSGKSKTGTFVE